jgi:hypothetical protein
VEACRKLLATARAAGPSAAARPLLAALEAALPVTRGSRAEASEPVLGATHVQSLLAALRSTPAATLHRLSALLSQAGARAPGLEKALLLKAFASHAPKLDAVERFARAIRGKPASELSDRTSPLDLDLSNPRSEGLAQRWSGSCVVTSAQLLRAEADPTYAWSLTARAAGSEQKKILEAFGGVAVDRDAPGGSGIVYGRIGEVPAAVNAGVPSKGYTQVSLDWLSPPVRQQRLANVRACLERGEDVLFTVLGHCLALTDARPFADGATRYLVQDPWHGTGQWITAEQLLLTGFPLPGFGQALTATNFYLPQGT